MQICLAMTKKTFYMSKKVLGGKNMKNKTFKKAILVISCFMLVTLIFSFYPFMTAKAEESDAPDSYYLYTFMLDEQTEENIKEDYLDFRSKNKAFPDVPFVSNRFSVDDVMIKEHYGPFDSAWVLYIEVNGECYPEVIYDDLIAGYKFVHPNALGYVVWKSGKICTLPEAYEQNIISDDDLHILAQLSPKTRETPITTGTSDISTSDADTQTSVSISETPSTTESQNLPSITQPSTTPKTGDNSVYALLLAAGLSLTAILFIKRVKER